MKRVILLILLIAIITLVSCDIVDPDDTILVQSPQDTEESSTDNTNETTVSDTTASPNTAPPTTSAPETTENPEEDTYNKDYSGRY